MIKMSKVGNQLIAFMMKWSGKSGGLILVNVFKKLGITNVDLMSDEEKEKLLNALSQDYLSTFLGHSRFLMARAELVSILGIPEGSYKIHDRGYRRPPISPDLFGKPKV